jgi:hypothetical protein
LKKTKTKIEKRGQATSRLVEGDHFVIEVEATCFRTEFISEHRISGLKSSGEKFLKRA